ncbi:alpha/beta fold hydrolase [Photobacterium lipolyticum]|uniref:Alpha/beta hydrolase n=1 Tax=Photobacterium lipolyticum TaxID=266810 RepID=A0A2T3MQN1_9GAMM|nr:alpha/beta hydrolase [Photobacterium lipolyticum]PSV99558.1 alpha/beta hydrolase [Photobacterium lipolyticum]
MPTPKIYRHIIMLLVMIFALSGCELVNWKAQQDKDELVDVGYSERFLPLKEGGTLKYWVGGKGEPLLLLHGFGGTAISTWKKEMLALNQNYMVIAPDLAWFGDSYSNGQPNLTTQTEAIWQLVDHLNIDKVNVAGISYGGFVTYNMMTTPERISKSIIIASPGPLFSDRDLTVLCQRADVDEPEDLFVPKNSDQVRRLFDHVFYEKKHMPDFIADQIYQNYFAPWQTEKEALIKTLSNERERIAQHSPSQLPPSMIIWGDSDQIFPLKNGIKLSQYLEVPVVVIPQTGHGVTNEQPTVVVDLIRAFII